MTKIKVHFKRFMLVMPIISIAGAACYPLDAWVRQALVLFTLLWLNIFILFEYRD